VFQGLKKDVVANVPKSLKVKAERLLQRIQAHPHLTWSDRGELSWQGQLIKNSNLIDLVNDVLRKRKRSAPARGWETFATVLRELNIPQELVGNSDRWAFIAQEQPKQGPSSASASSASFKTPRGSAAGRAAAASFAATEQAVKRRKKEQRQRRNWLQSAVKKHREQMTRSHFKQKYGDDDDDAFSEETVKRALFQDWEEF